MFAVCSRQGPVLQLSTSSLTQIKPIDLQSMHAASYLLCKLLWRWSFGKIVCVGEQSLIFCKHIRYVFRFCVKASRATDRHLLCLTTELRIYEKKPNTKDLLLPFMLNGHAFLLQF